ncbi:hypothetical protein CRU92_10830 [Arcobacter sp. FW59]|nr:hypothetical protein CRU92_10830 [Arcobacter sp. FW59]
MAKLTDDLKDKILSDFHIGKTQNWLATNYNLSPATINKLCKGLTPKYKDKVNTVISIKSDLSQESEYQAFTFDKEVNEQLRLKNLVFKATEKIIKNIDKAVSQKRDILNEEGKVIRQEDLLLDSKSAKEYIDAIDKASLTLGINQRHSNSQINVNTQNNLEQNNNNITVEWD